MKQLIGLFFTCIAASSHALPIAVLGDDKLIGFDEIYDRDGSEYQVRFATGRFEDAYGMTKDEFRQDGLSNFDFQPNATIVASLISFFSSEEGHFFEQNPEYIYGCLENHCDIYIPYVVSDKSSEHLSEHSALIRWRSYLHDEYYLDADTDRWGAWNLRTGGENWAVWTEVPEPSSLSLLAAGIIAVFVNRRRRRASVIP